MEIFMKEDGRMIKLTAMDNICTQMEQPILVIGLKINSKVVEPKPGQMEPGTRVITSMARSMDRAA